jgi:hypothetical protein
VLAARSSVHRCTPVLSRIRPVRYDTIKNRIQATTEGSDSGKEADRGSHSLVRGYCCNDCHLPGIGCLPRHAQFAPVCPLDHGRVSVSQAAPGVISLAGLMARPARILAPKCPELCMMGCVEASSLPQCRRIRTCFSVSFWRRLHPTPYAHSGSRTTICTVFHLSKRSCMHVRWPEGEAVSAPGYGQEVVPMTSL